MLFKEIVDARTHARTDDGRRTLKDHKSSLEHFVLRWAKNQTLKTLPEPRIEPGTPCTQIGCVTTAPPSQLSLSIEVKPFNCFDAMGRNVNKQSQICGPDIFTNTYFLHNIFTWMNNYIWQFLIFTGVGFAA